MINDYYSSYLKRSGRIQNIKRKTDTGYGKVALVHFFDGPLVLGGEATVQELRNDGRFSDSSRSHDNNFVAYIGRRQSILRVVAMDSGNGTKQIHLQIRFRFEIKCDNENLVNISKPHQRV